MKSFLPALVLLLLIASCTREDNCGPTRYVEPATDTCECRPEFTEVGDVCVPNDELDGAVDAGPDSTTDAPEEPLVVVSTTPTDGATEVEPDTSISIAFNMPVDEATLESGLSISSLGEVVPAEVSWDAASMTATLQLELMALRRTYQVVARSSISTPSGTSLGSDYAFEFVTRDGAWGEIVSLEIRVEDAELAGPSADIDNVGQAVACWRHEEAGGAAEFGCWCAMRYSSSWRVASKIDDTPGSCSVSAAMSQGTDEALVLVRRRDSLWSTRHTTRWEAPEQLFDSLVSSASVGSSDSGYTAVWLSTDTLFAARFTVGSGWGGTEFSRRVSREHQNRHQHARQRSHRVASRCLLGPTRSA